MEVFIIFYVLFCVTIGNILCAVILTDKPIREVNILKLIGLLLFLPSTVMVTILIIIESLIKKGYSFLSKWLEYQPFKK